MMGKVEYFPIKDMQTPPLTFDQPFMDDGECGVQYGKNNEKILRLIFFELSSKIGVMTSQKNDTKITITRKIKIGKI